MLAVRLQPPVLVVMEAEEITQATAAPTEWGAQAPQTEETTERMTLRALAATAKATLAEGLQVDRAEPPEAMVVVEARATAVEGVAEITPPLEEVAELAGHLDRAHRAFLRLHISRRVTGARRRLRAETAQ